MSVFIHHCLFFVMPDFVLRPQMPNSRIISKLIFAGVSYASIVTDSVTLKATSRNIVTDSDSWYGHSSACDLDQTKVLNKILLADVVSLG